MRGNILEGFIIGTKQCPYEFVINISEKASEGESFENLEYEDWMVQDQILLDWLYNSMEADIVAEVMGFETSKSL